MVLTAVKTRLENQFASQDSLPALDDFYNCISRKKLKKSGPGQLVMWIAYTPWINASIVGGIFAGVTLGGVLVFDHFSIGYLLFYIDFWIIFILSYLVYHGHQRIGVILEKKRDVGTNEWWITVSTEEGRIKEAYVCVGCVQLPWIVSGVEKWPGIPIGPSQSGKVKVPAELARLDAEVEVNDKGRVIQWEEFAKIVEE